MRELSRAAKAAPHRQQVELPTSSDQVHKRKRDLVEVLAGGQRDKQLSKEPRVAGLEAVPGWTVRDPIAEVEEAGTDRCLKQLGPGRQLHTGVLKKQGLATIVGSTGKCKPVPHLRHHVGVLVHNAPEVHILRGDRHHDRQYQATIKRRRAWQS